MDEELIELLKEMAASEPDGQIEIPRRHVPGLDRKRYRARLLVDKGHAEWVSRSKVRITASGHDFIAKFESQDADSKVEERPEAKQPWYKQPAWVSAVAAVVIAAFAALAYFKPGFEPPDLPAPPEWICSLSLHKIDFIDGAMRGIRYPVVHWQDQGDEAQLAGYRVHRAAPHSVFDPPGTEAFAPISGLIPLDTPKFTDLSCPGSCGYRIVSEDVSGRQSRLSQFVACDVGPDPVDVDCNRSCYDVPKALKQIERFYD